MDNSNPQTLISSDVLNLTPVGSESASLVYEIYLNSPTYFRRVDGIEPTLEMALRDILETPPKKSAEYLKLPALIYLGAQAIGYVDLHVHHRSKDSAYIGLLVLKESIHGKGLGRRAYQLVEDFLLRDYGIRKIFLGVSDRNQVNAYWGKMGFAPNGFTYKWNGQLVESLVVEMEKVIGK